MINNLHILIADDDESNFQLLKILLRSMNPTIYRAYDGKEAIEIALENPLINLILMDLKMPDIDGFEATMAIKKAKPKMPIIAQTAYALVGDKEKALQAGCDYYISKPINHNILIEIIEKAITEER